MAQTIYTIVTTEYNEHNVLGLEKTTTTRSFTDKENAISYFRGNILSKLEELGYEDVDVPMGISDFNLRYACDDVEDDWFESQIFESVLD